MTQTRLYEIDLYRFIAAALVVVFHYTFVGSMLGYTPNIKLDSIGEISRYAYLGINFFFIISGFVILMSAKDKQPKRFLLSCFIRLYPVYWFGMIATSIAIIIAQQDQFNLSLSQFFVNLTMWQSGFSVSHIDAPYWTLWIEWQFYAVIAVLAAFGGLKYMPHLIALSLISCVGVLMTEQHSRFDVWNNAFPHWWGYFATGCLFFLLYRDGINVYRGCLLLLAVVFVVQQNWVFAELMQYWYGVDFSAITIVTINLLFLMLFCSGLWCQKHPLRRSGFIILGAMSYPLYVFHQNIGFIILNAFEQQAPHAVLVLFTAITVIMIAYCVHRFWEKPCQTFLQKMVNKDNHAP